MRIITGIAKGKKLLSPPESSDVRPTTEMTKEGVFSAIQFEIAGKDFLDIFSGSGQMGLEAVSRGAASAVFVDCSETSMETIRKNIERTGLSASCRAIRSEYGEYIKNCAKRGTDFDMIFADPPYAKDMAPELCKRMVRAGMIRKGGVIMLETAADDFSEDDIPQDVRDKVSSVKKYKFSKCFVYFVRMKNGE